jgi:hypothetical protein
MLWQTMAKLYKRSNYTSRHVVSPYLKIKKFRVYAWRSSFLKQGNPLKFWSFTEVELRIPLFFDMVCFCGKLDRELSGQQWKYFLNYSAIQFTHESLQNRMRNLDDNFALGCGPGADYPKILIFKCMLERTDAIKNKIVGPITFVLAYPTVLGRDRLFAEVKRVGAYFRLLLPRSCNIKKL